jgi:probable F420-dependent oxidoreductase
MQFGMMIMARGPGGRAPGLTAMAQAAEQGGLDMIGINDHVVVPGNINSAYPYSDDGVWPGAAVGECLELVTAASFIAAATDRIRLLTSVMVVPYRPAVLAAKMLATVEVLSGGRLTVGCGAGWMREEADAMGVPPFAERGKVTDEYIDAFKRLWTQDAPAMAGDYVQFDNVVFEPKPLQKPHPPIWIGGEGGAAIRRAARVGDGWYPSNHNPQHLLDTPERYAKGSARLNEEANKLGRDGDSIHRAYLAFYPVDRKARVDAVGGRRIFTGSAEAIRDDIGTFAKEGVETIVFSVGGREINQILDNIAWLTGVVLPAR